MSYKQSLNVVEVYVGPKLPKISTKYNIGSPISTKSTYNNISPSKYNKESPISTTSTYNNISPISTTNISPTTMNSWGISLHNTSASSSFDIEFNKFLIEMKNKLNKKM